MDEMTPIDPETRQVVLVYDSGMVIEAYPPITIYENGQVRVLDVVSRTELDDSLVILEVAQ
jgi:hypothetical protein